MTLEQFLERMDELRAQWSQDSNHGNPNQTKLFEFCEQFIEGMDGALGSAGGHPDPPPPRVR